MELRRRCGCPCWLQGGWTTMIFKGPFKLKQFYDSMFLIQIGCSFTHLRQWHAKSLLQCKHCLNNHLSKSHRVLLCGESRLQVFFVFFSVISLDFVLTLEHVSAFPLSTGSVQYSEVHVLAESLCMAVIKAVWGKGWLVVLSQRPQIIQTRCQVRSGLNSQIMFPCG